MAKFRIGKKGIFMPVLLVFTLILFSWAYNVLVFGAGATSYRMQIGKNQADLYESYMDAEKSMLYLNEAGKQAAYYGISELADNGGYKKEEINDCGEVVGYKIWHLNGKDCYPNDIGERFEELFDKNMKSYLDNYEIYLLDKDYEKGLRYVFDISLDEGEKITINGNARENYIFGSKIDGKEFRIKYDVDPSFKIIVDYNFLDYNELKIIMTDAIRLCQSAECFNRQLNNNKYKWKVQDRDKYVLFEADTGKRASNQDAVVKFAVGKDV